MKLLKGVVACTFGMFLVFGGAQSAAEKDSDKKCGGYLEKCDTNKNGSDHLPRKHEPAG